MLKMMAGTTSAQGHSTDNFTAEELEDAKQHLIRRMVEFWEDSKVGYIIRERAIEAFKKEYGLKKDSSIEVIKVNADLANEDEISRAIEMNHPLSDDNK